MDDGGAGHLVGQGAGHTGQAPMGMDGVSAMSGGQGYVPSSRQSFGPGPVHGYAPSAPG
jgi:hypothetical protein